jgi:cystathionine beta-lyase
MKVGWFFSDNADYMARVRANHRADLTSVGLMASQAAYTGGGDWLDQVVTYIDGNHDFAEKFIGQNIPLIKYVKAQGTFLAWLDVSGLSGRIDAKRLAEEANAQKTSPRLLTPENMVERYLVQNAKVHMNPGSSYGLGGANHMRMNIATSRKLVELALTNIAKAARAT